jgi:hypothetical protein
MSTETQEQEQVQEQSQDQEGVSMKIEDAQKESTSTDKKSPPNTNVREFEYEDRTYFVSRPNQKIQGESDPIYMKAFKQALKDGFYIGAEIDKVLKELDLDDDSIKEQEETYTDEIKTLAQKLKDEEYKDLDEGYKMAMGIKELREKIDSIADPRRELESKSAHMRAENKRFSYYAYACIKDENGNRLWNSFNDFEDDDSDLAVKAATELMLLLYDVGTDKNKKAQASLPENKWLIDNGFMNEDLEMIKDKDTDVNDK